MENQPSPTRQQPETQRHIPDPSDRATYVRYLVDHGVETPTLAKHLQEDDIICLASKLGYFWKVVRLHKRLDLCDRIDISFMPAIDKHDLWERKYCKQFGLDEPIVLMRVAYAD